MLEGHIAPELDYDDWISDSTTWVKFADKCAVFHMYSLATDFYGLGILKDPNAFRKPMLWYRFAKSCSRCGRTSDAELSIKVQNKLNLFLFIYHAIFVIVASFDKGPSQPSASSCAQILGRRRAEEEF
jgi:hypothetical protein